jgi:arabinose-5-phosphate isomerase
VNRVITEEGQAILALLPVEDPSISALIDLILNTVTSSKSVFVSGFGKCSFVAGKLAATYSSIGIPAVYLDASSALHGDIGMVRRGDIVILLSKSGETQEMVDLENTLLSMGISTALITNTSNCTLSTLCDITVLLPMTDEACHLKLAPTTSTTLMMAVGDAIGVEVSSALGFTTDKFYKFHSKGSLGKGANG